MRCIAPATAQPVTPPAHYANIQLADPAKEASAKALMETLRCLVCQGQSIADSDADMAASLGFWEGFRTRRLTAA